MIDRYDWPALVPGDRGAPRHPAGLRPGRSRRTQHPEPARRV